MFSIVNSMIARVKALFVTHAALELEAELTASCAERRAELLRQATRYEDEGLSGIAQHLRKQADELSAQRPGASVLAALAHVRLDQAQSIQQTPALPAPKKKKGAKS